MEKINKRCNMRLYEAQASTGKAVLIKFLWFLVKLLHIYYLITAALKGKLLPHWMKASSTWISTAFWGLVSGGGRQKRRHTTGSLQSKGFRRGQGERERGATRSCRSIPRRINTCNIVEKGTLQKVCSSARHYKDTASAGDGGWLFQDSAGMI